MRQHTTKFTTVAWTGWTASYQYKKSEIIFK